MPVQTAHVLALRGRAPRGGDRQPRAAGHDVEGSDSERVRAERLWVGVVRSPPGWVRRRVDVHYPALGLPTETHERLTRRRRELRMRGLCEEGAHNAAWEELDVDNRYRDHLAEAPAREKLAALVARDRPLVLVTDRQPGFRCHRTVLADEIEARAGDA